MDIENQLDAQNMLLKKMVNSVELLMQEVFCLGFNNRESSEEFRQPTEEQKAKFKQAFAVNRNPDKEKIAALVSELQLEKDRVRKYSSLISQ
ncbi:hypothetical protein B9Z55_026001 [Caenorhabditis nigoni]|uniref:Homeobox domain-containing protein n=1 Tax=Caenorhabditis nigoni TaxID=1611254 RepID=A0A2G5T1I7_9PELO|nr:hypothetical protein B9Z55_026001 [Caenorhabditis nigoni]